MFVINEDLSIYVTRGDIVHIAVSLESKGVPYSFKAGDIVRMKVYGKKNCENVVLQKDFPVVYESEKVEIFLTEEDTKIGGVISKQTDYWYEIELNPETNPQTIIGYDEDGAKIFKLFPEGKDLPITKPDITPEDIPLIDVELDLTSNRPVENQAIARGIERMARSVTDKLDTEIERVESDVETQVSKLETDISELTEELNERIEDGEERIEKLETVRNGIDYPLVSDFGGNATEEVYVPRDYSIYKIIFSSTQKNIQKAGIGFRIGDSAVSDIVGDFVYVDKDAAMINRIIVKITRTRVDASSDKAQYWTNVSTVKAFSFSGVEMSTDSVGIEAIYGIV